MKIIDKIDLREQPSSCSQHPLVRLKKITDKLKTGEAIEVITDEEVIPLSTLEIIAKKKNLSINILESRDKLHRLLLVKQD